MTHYLKLMIGANQQFFAFLSEASNYYEIRKYDEALAKINEALVLQKDNIQARNLKAAILIESWNGNEKTKHWISEAIDHLKKLIEIDSSNNKFYFMNLGNAYSKRATFEMNNIKSLNVEIVRDLETAKACFEESLQICEKQPGVWINKGNILDYLGRHFEALHCYNKAIILDSEKHNAWGCRGICCWSLSNLVDNKEDKNILFSNAMLCIAIELEKNPFFEIDDSFRKYIETNILKNKSEIDVLKAKLKEKIQNKLKTIDYKFNFSSSLNLSETQSNTSASYICDGNAAICRFYHLIQEPIIR